MITGLSANTYQNLQLNAGAFLLNFDYSTYTDAEALKAGIKTALETRENVLGATRGGGSFRVTPETRKIEADGVRYGFKGDTVTDSVDVSMTGTLIEVNADNMTRILTSADKVKSGDKTTITMRTNIELTDYIDKICWVGDLSNGGLVLISMDNALNTSGLDFSFSDKSEATLAFEFHAHQANVDDVDKAPFEIVYFDKKTT